MVKIVYMVYKLQIQMELLYININYICQWTTFSHH